MKRRVGAGSNLPALPIIVLAIAICYAQGEAWWILALALLVIILSW